MIGDWKRFEKNIIFYNLNLTPGLVQKKNLTPGDYAPLKSEIVQHSLREREGWCNSRGSLIKGFVFELNH